MILVIDNYDSFTWNLVHYLMELGAKVEVVRNDAISAGQAVSSGAKAFLLSPGPCTPNEAGISMATIRHFAGKLPILGVCLGHQAIGQVYGGKVIRAGQVMHGKVSAVYHKDQGIFRGLSNPLKATRYHSLVIDKDTLPDCLEVTAWTRNDDGSVEEIMGVRHKTLPIEGVQFHPESIMTEQGHELLRNFLKTR